MSRFDKARNLLHAQLVYWGPNGSGKTITLTNLRRFLDPEERFRLYSVAGTDGSTLSFDLLPIEEFRLGISRVRARAYAVPGAPGRGPARLAILRNADAVVFVADARRIALEANRQSLEELRTALRVQGRDPADVPIVFAFNCQDQPETVSTGELRVLLGCEAEPVFETVATDGRGVFETFSEVFRRMARALAAEHEELAHAGESPAPSVVLPQLVRGATGSTPATRVSGPHHLVFEVADAGSDAAQAMAALMSLAEAHIDADARNQQLEGRNRELMAINRVARSILSAMEADNLLVVLLDATAEHLAASHATCVVFDPTESGALRTHVTGFGRDPILGLPQEAAHKFFALLRQSDGPVPASAVHNPDFLHAIQRVDRRVKRGMFQPIKATSGKPVGWLGIYATADEPPLTTQGLLFLSSISRLAALGLDKIALLHKVQTFNERLNDDVHKRTGELEMAYAKIRALNRGLEARVTERTRALEEANRQLKEARAGAEQAARLRGMGQLATSFAQEIESPLDVLRRKLEAMRDGLDDLRGLVASAPDDPSSSLAAIEDFEDVINASLEGAERIGSVLGSLRRFGGAEQSSQRVSLNGLIADAVTLLEERIQAGAKLDLRLGTLDKFDGDSGELSQVVLALLTNAIEAVERRGARGRIVVTTFQAKERITLMVNDDGDGITPELLPSVFEPFSTTKEDEASAGLGLHCAMKAVETHGGSIRVRSKPSEGTTVTVVLPLAATDPSEEPKAEASG